MPKWWLIFMGAALVLILVAVKLDPNPGKGAVTVPATPTAVVVANEYPVDAVVRFETICKQGGSSLQTCVCLIHGMENRYSYARFQELIAADNPKAPEYATVAQGCAVQ